MVGAQPSIHVRAKNGKVKIMDPMKDNVLKDEEFAFHPFSIPIKMLEQWKPKSVGQLPDTFCGIHFFFYI